MPKEIRIEGGIYCPASDIDITREEFENKFLEALESVGLAFGGSIREFTEEELKERS